MFLVETGDCGPSEARGMWFLLLSGGTLANLFCGRYEAAFSKEE
jgi:hypothetical protein